MNFERNRLVSYLNGRVGYSSPSSGISVRSNCLNNVFPVPNEIRLCADLYVRHLLNFYAKEFAVSKKYLTCYRMHGNNNWAGKRSAVSKRRRIDVDKIIEKYVEKHAYKLGYNIRELKEWFKSNRLRNEILLCNLKGQKLRAFKKALIFEEFPRPQNFLYRAFKKIKTLLYAILPSPKYQRIVEFYRQSILFTFVHRFFVHR